MNFLTDVLITALAALIGASAGSWAALTRFKRERAFDRQLGWYEQVVAVLQDLRISLGHIKISSQEDSARLDDDIRSAQELLEKFVVLKRRGVLYSSQDVVVALDAAVSEAVKELRGVSRETIRDHFSAETSARLVQVFGRALHRVLEDARPLLGQKQISWQVIDTTPPPQPSAGRDAE